MSARLRHGIAALAALVVLVTCGLLFLSSASEALAVGADPADVVKTLMAKGDRDGDGYLSESELMIALGATSTRRGAGGAGAQGAVAGGIAGVNVGHVGGAISGQEGAGLAAPVLGNSGTLTGSPRTKKGGAALGAPASGYAAGAGVQNVDGAGLGGRGGGGVATAGQAGGELSTSRERFFFVPLHKLTAVSD